MGGRRGQARVRARRLLARRDRPLLHPVGGRRHVSQPHHAARRRPVSVGEAALQPGAVIPRGDESLTIQPPDHLQGGSRRDRQCVLRVGSQRRLAVIEPTGNHRHRDPDNGWTHGARLARPGPRGERDNRSARQRVRSTSYRRAKTGCVRLRITSQDSGCSANAPAHEQPCQVCCSRHIVGETELWPPTRDARIGYEIAMGEIEDSMSG